ncbi:MAG: flippase-like domain-containing protein [Lachnospiraceae bacterium]|nr:flippase-like domain-containing protein [Lachnospiraceae bacterium]
MSKKEKTWNGVLLVVLTFITISVLIKNDELSNLDDILGNLKLGYLGLAVLAMVVNTLFDSAILKLNSDYLGHKLKFRQACYLTVHGQYYSMVTPLGSGGQPMQIYAMKRRYDIPVSKASAATIHKCFTYQYVIAVMAIGAFFVLFSFLKQSFPSYFWVIVLAVLINVLATAALVLVVYNGKWVIKITEKICNFLHRFRLTKNVKAKRVLQIVEEYDMNLKEMKDDKKLFLKSFFLNFCAMTCYFSIAYFVFRAMNVSNLSFVGAFCMQILVYAVTSCIPTPGNAGASESGFYILYAVLVPNKNLGVAMLLWRIIIYYLNLFISAIIVWIDFLIQGKEEGKIDNDQPEGGGI